MGKLTHVDAAGKARMVDVSSKEATRRLARASGRVEMGRKTVAAIRERRTPKGDPLETARIAGIAAAKRTPELIPLCHPLLLEHVEVTAELGPAGVAIESRVVMTGKTGAEMEALTAVAAAALTIYDMCKAIDKTMVISDIRLEEKSGGKSGSYMRGKQARTRR